MATNIVKATEISLAYDYPQNHLNKREQKVLEVGEQYDPATPGDWTIPPATISDALDSLAAGGAVVGPTMRAATALWDFSVDGGALGNVTLASADALPDNAIIVEVVQDILIAPDSATDTGTIQLNVPTDGNLGASKTANGAATSSAAILAGTVKTTAARTLRVTIATEAATVGKIRYFVRYYLGE